MNLHIRLRNISHLVPTHITHIYVQWMPYSIVWLYLIKCVVHTQSYVIKHKKIFEYFSFFGKCFCFEKFQKIQKFYNFVFGDSLAGHSSRKALVASLLRRFHDSLASENSSHEKHLENFSKFLGFCLFGDLVTSGSSSRELTQKVLRLTRRWISLLRKRLRQNFQKFC